jgi:hypothetical protein
MLIARGKNASQQKDELLLKKPGRFLVSTNFVVYRSFLAF